MKNVKKKFKGKPVEMLTVAKTVCEHFRAHKDELIPVRSIWDDPFISDLEAGIDQIIIDYLGLDPKKDLKLATKTVLEVQENAIYSLSLFKVQLEVDYVNDKSRLDSLLDILGYKLHWERAYRYKDQESLVQLLYTFDTNMTADLKNEFITNGVRDTLIDRIIGYAHDMNSANVTQEALKGSSKSTSVEAITEFNKVYADLMAICKVSQRVLAQKADAKAKFIYSKLLNTLNADGKREVKQDDQTQKLAS